MCLRSARRPPTVKSCPRRRGRGSKRLKLHDSQRKDGIDSPSGDAVARTPWAEGASERGRRGWILKKFLNIITVIPEYNYICYKHIDTRYRTV